MKARIIAALFFCFISGSGLLHAQNLDSLKQELNKEKEDTTRVRILLSICGQKSKITSNELLNYAQTALALSNKNNYRYGKVRSLISLSSGNIQISKYDAALQNLNEALKICPEKEENLKPLSDIYNNLGCIYTLKSNFTPALENYLKALKIYELKKFKSRAAGAYFNISTLYYQMDNFKMAAEYALKAEKVFEERKDTAYMCTTLSFLGEIYFTTGENSKAVDYYSRSLKLSEKMKNKSYAVYSWMGLGEICQKEKNYKEAVLNYQRGLDLAKESNTINYAASCLQKLGTTYTLLGKDDEALSALKEALKLAQEIGDIQVIKNAHYYIAEIYKTKKNFGEAYQHLYAGNKLSDSLYNAENSRNFSELSSKYENEKKEKEIALLNVDLLSKEKEQGLLNAQLRNRNSIITGTAVGAVLLVLSLLLLFNRRRLIQNYKHQAEISQQREKTTAAVVQAQENEQTRIAKDLHDGVGTFLSTLKI